MGLGVGRDESSAHAYQVSEMVGIGASDGDVIGSIGGRVGADAIGAHAGDRGTSGAGARVIVAIRANSADSAGIGKGASGGCISRGRTFSQ